jgi:Transglutaminase-like superfamily
MTFLVLRAFKELILYDLLTALGGFKRARACVLRTTRKEREAPPETVKRVADAVDIASVFYYKRVMCLHRSFAAVRLMRKSGVKADLIIGSRPLPFLSHAWVEVGNQIVNDKPGYKRKLQVMERI